MFWVWFSEHCIPLLLDLRVRPSSLIRPLISFPCTGARTDLPRKCQRKTQYRTVIVSSNKAATSRGSLAFVIGCPNITANGLVQVSPLRLSSVGAGVSRLTNRKIRLHMQNIHHACIMNEIPKPSLMSFVFPNTGRSSTKEATPIRNPASKVTTEASFVPRRQKTPKRKTVVMGGARSAAITLMAAKILVNLPPCVDHKTASSMITMELTRPTKTSR
jgi:hypothetical protein